MAHFAGTRKLAFAIRSSKIQGKGAFATRRIPKGARIIEYLGECIDEDEADIRYPDDEMGRHHTFLFAIGDGSRVLDAGPLDWPAKYINHSCDPNCEAVEEEDGRVFIGALRTIPEGAELLYDYAYERTAEHTDDDEKLYVCRCGSPKCRGTIMAPAKVKKDRKAKKKDRKKEKREKKATKDRHHVEEMHASVKRSGKKSDGTGAAKTGVKSKSRTASGQDGKTAGRTAKKAGSKAAKRGTKASA